MQDTSAEIGHQSAIQTHQPDPYRPTIPCKYYLNSRCKHGVSGKECKFKHQKTCRRWLNYGNHKKYGCTLREKCENFHPKLCWSSLNSRTCTNQTCIFNHIKGTKREVEIKMLEICTESPKAQCNSTSNKNTTNHANSEKILNQRNQRLCSQQVNNLKVWNIRGLYPKRDQTKVPLLGELNDLEEAELMVIMESHLNPNILDSEIQIPHFDIHRTDRTNRSRGGVMNYVKDTLSSTPILSYSNDVCEVLIIKIQQKDCVVCTIYRPPDCKANEFLPFMDKVSVKLQEHKKSDIIIVGDFNFADIDWSDPLCRKFIETTSDINIQANKLLNLTDDLFLQQLIHQPTRNENILDLVFTNITDNLFDCNITKYKTLSDHNLIEIKLNYNQDEPTSSKKIDESVKPTGYKKYNFHKADYDSINRDLSLIDWQAELNNKSVNDQLTKFNDIVLDIIPKHTSEKQVNKNTYRSKFYKDRRALWRRRRRLRRKKFTSDKNQKLLDEIELSIKKSHIAERLENEHTAIDKITSNAKYFYSYANKTRKCKAKVGPLINKDTNAIISDPKDIAEALQTQYCSVFSSPDHSKQIDDTEDFFNEDENENPILSENSPNKEDLVSDLNQIKEHGFRQSRSCSSQLIDHPTLSDISFDENDVVNAILQIKEHSAAGPDGVPAIFLRKCSNEISKPLSIIFRNSINTGEVPNILKDAVVTPIHKGGLKSDPQNYRPVSLLSQILKVLEKVIAVKIVSYLEDNNILNKNQHGFRKFRSCLSQLIEHYDNILQAVSEGKNVDIIYLDYKKAFDVVDHHILLRKLKSRGITGNIGKWIANFISDRKQSVAVNQKLSRSEPVSSGVPQGSVLGPILFLVMISDIDDEVINSTVSSFADDTKVSHIIQLRQDCLDLQSSLETIYDWSNTNNLQFNELKFKAMRYGVNEDTMDYEYKTPTGNTIPNENTVKDLGILQSNNLQFSEQIETIASKCRSLSGWILRTFITRETNPMLKLFNSLLLPKIDYCSQLWSPHQTNELNKLEAIQRRFTNQITSMKELDYWSRLAKLRLYSLERRAERYKIIYTWKIIEGLAPNLSTNKIQTKLSDRRGRLCILPKPAKQHICSAKINTIRENSFCVQGPKLFNALPREIRNITEVQVDTFKHHLDKLLTTIPDQPGIPGYAGYRAAATNSLLQQIEHRRRAQRC